MACSATCDGKLVGRVLGTVATLSQHKETVRSVVIVRVEWPGRRLRVGDGGRGCGPVSDLWGLGSNRLGRLRSGCLYSVCLFTLGRGADSRSVEIKRAWGRAAAGKLGEKRLGVRTGGREHRPAAARGQASPQPRLVRGRETSSQMVSVTEVVIRWSRQHGRTERAGA